MATINNERYNQILAEIYRERKGVIFLIKYAYKMGKINKSEMDGALELVMRDCMANNK